MHSRHTVRLVFAAALVAFVSGTASAQQAAGTKFEPYSGQPGKDVVWVPTPQELVEKMLDMAKVTPQDFLIDLGSGDGRTVIAAARRGARALGIEYNPDMVNLSQENAKNAGVAERATFMKADIFESADTYRKAQVITLFLLPSLNVKLRPTILEMRPGTRIVSNTFTMDDWTPDETQTVGGDCVSWCTAHMWIVPAKVDGTWEIQGQGALTLKQNYQMVSGTLGSTQISDGKVRGDEITFTAGGRKYAGRVSGSTISGSGWSASKR